jgi:hypothetical protein
LDELTTSQLSRQTRYSHILVARANAHINMFLSQLYRLTTMFEDNKEKQSMRLK